MTLLELLVVLTLAGLLLVVSYWGGSGLRGRWRLQRAAEQVHEDLRTAQATAEMAGGLTLGDGGLVSRRIFLVFDAERSGYTAYHWRDADGNGTPDTGESQQIWHKTLPPGVTFGRSATVDRRACSNTSGVPGQFITFARPGYPPCNDRPCIKFDPHGFSEIGPGAIYLVDGERSQALTATRPGHFTRCAWNGRRWQ